LGNYIDETYADDYILINPRIKQTWSALSSGDKADYIDYFEQQLDNVAWIGIKSVSSQSGEFPRDFVTAARKYPMYPLLSEDFKDRLDSESGTIPTSVKDAICELIIYYLDNRQFDKLRALQRANVESFKAGSASFNFGDRFWNHPLPPPVWALINYLSLQWWSEQHPFFLERV
jgi:hypothetical protein